MKLKEIKYKPIGIIHSPFKELKGVPIQPFGANGIKGDIEINKKYIDGLKDLNGFSHIILIYHFHLSEGFSMNVVPFLDTSQHGVFATRAPKRPNALGISVVKLVSIEGNIINVENIDIVEGTPLLDIKPFVTKFDNVEDEKNGWLAAFAQNSKEMRSDERFNSKI
jgi:tRNA-Thr(GGU) m(6)t(6)A37 methyltransferase TsaA